MWRKWWDPLFRIKINGWRFGLFPVSIGENGRTHWNQTHKYLDQHEEATNIFFSPYKVVHLCSIQIPTTIPIIRVLGSHWYYDHLRRPTPIDTFILQYNHPSKYFIYLFFLPFSHAHKYLWAFQQKVGRLLPIQRFVRGFCKTGEIIGSIFVKSY